MKKLVGTLVLASAMGLFACGDDGGGGGDADAAVDSPDAMAFTCDPVGPNPGMGALLNAPVESDVQIIVKDPQHPGDPGPDDLP